ncbi:MAG: SGNH/GDSL hydrolase family protein [Bacteroidetes bacterium]|nr:SGNH/GDSL hydrolase family protein [Bacteroidota bacterium]
MEISRRNFFRNAGISTAAVAGLPLLANPCTGPDPVRMLGSYFSKGDVVLFQGDSITDAGRDRQHELANNSRSFGGGYAFLAASWLLETMAEKELTIYNRGISGHKVYQLDERWDKDCLLLKPNVLSILIGVNDYWHMRNGNYEGTPEIYETDYRALLNRTKEQYPDIKLVICQPFILTDTKAVDESWVEAFRPYQEIAQKICQEYTATWVPFQEAFSEAAEIAHPTYWTNDGVHPSMAGAQLMARTWLESLG